MSDAFSSCPQDLQSHLLTLPEHSILQVSLYQVLNKIILTNYSFIFLCIPNPSAWTKPHPTPPRHLATSPSTVQLKEPVGNLTSPFTPGKPRHFSDSPEAYFLHRTYAVTTCLMKYLFLSQPDKLYEGKNHVLLISISPASDTS